MISQHLQTGSTCRGNGRIGGTLMNTEFTDNEIKLIWAMAIIMIPLVIDATIRLIELG